MEKNEIPLTMKGWDFDRYLQEKFPFLIGIDEVGRGSLAGPVVTCALSFKDCGDPIPYLNDSKKLSEKLRLTLFPKILARTQAYGIGVALKEEIDQINIFQATKLAMYRALADMKETFPIPPSHNVALLVDGLSLSYPGWKNFKIIKGDSISPHIMAASIVAKVVRDSLMDLYHNQYPLFHFHQNKGYGTSHHRSTLRSHYTPIHRKTFAPLKDFLKTGEVFLC